MTKIPTAEKSGFIATLNNMGYMTAGLDPYSQRFVDYAAQHKNNKVLEIGAAYGVATLAALRHGCKMVANDLDNKHLEILKSNTPEQYLKNLELKAGSLPKELSFPENSFKAILICRGLHFFKGEDIELSAKKLYDWLMPGGKLFVVAETPYMGTVLPFLPTYLKNKAANKK